MRTFRWLIPFLWIGLGIRLSACSFAAIERAPAPYRTGDPIECSYEMTFPLVDMALTILSGALTVSLLSAAEDSGNDSELRGSAYGSGALALGTAASSLYGLYQVNRCRRLRNDHPDMLPSTRAPIDDPVPPGQHGGACLANGQCDEDLVCDPMQTCIPRGAL